MGKGTWAMMVLLCSILNVWGQRNIEVFQATEEQRLKLNKRSIPEPLDLSFNKPDTISISISSPFFDDFSSGDRLPDTSLWILPLGKSEYPVISYGQAINPPSIGTLTFDGSSTNGQAYDNNSLSSGVADEIRTHFIDLSGFLPADQLFLSFALQPQGRGNAPESTDNFRVYFFVDSLGNQQYIEVFKLPGSSLESFQQYIIPINRRSYFHDDFQIVFQSEGSRNGYLDHWHLDYVRLGPGRSSRDTVFNDIALSSINRSLFKDYTLLPWFIAKGKSDIFQEANISLHNFSSSPSNVEYNQQLTLPGGLNLTQGNTANLDPFENNQVEAGAFDQAIDLTGNTRLTYDWVIKEADDVPENNFFSQSVSLGQVYAYDDGEADGIYGLSETRGFGSLFFKKGGTQLLEAVHISFVPLLNFNPVSNTATYMDEQSFRLVVWSSPHPDSVLYQQIGNLKVAYGDSLNHFERYQLNQPVQLPDSFWLGIQQLNQLPLGVGLDLSLQNSRNTIHFDSAGVWIRSDIEGSLMIRPEVSLKEEPVSRHELVHYHINLFPNPVPRGSFIKLRLAGEFPSIHWRLISMGGRIIKGIERERDGSDGIKIFIPAETSPGIYVLQGLDMYSGLMISERIIVEK